MASLQRGKILVKNLTPEQVGRALAEFVAVRSGTELDRMCRVRTDYFFDHRSKQFRSARVEVEVA